MNADFVLPLTKKMRVDVKVLAILSLVLIASGELLADTVTIEVDAIATGSLGDKNFTNSAITITGVGDTADAMANGAVNILLDGLEVFVDVDQVGSAIFTDQIQAVSNNNSDLGGFGNTSNNFGLLLVFNPAFGNYDLTTSLDPVSGFGTIVIGVPHETSAGPLRLFSIYGDATFSATVSKACQFAPGDVNQDGVVDLLDVAPFVDILTEGTFACEADVNEDRAVDLLDVQPFVSLLSDG